MAVWVGGLGRLVGWLVGRARAAPCESSLYLDDKEPGRTGEPNLTQWNGRMVMETAFNLHRRSLFVDWLRVGVLLTRSLSLFRVSSCACTLPPAAACSRGCSPSSAAAEKSIVLYLSIRSYILFRLRDARAKR